MRIDAAQRGKGLIMIFILGLSVLSPAFGRAGGQEASTFTSPLLALLPASDVWRASEPPRQFLPETLFEYINGAAESYISYDFQELIVAQYEKKDVPSATLTLEVYDLGEPRNAFGIYGSERYPESRFIPVGTQGYYEDGSLNFLAGRYYVKMMGYDCGPDAEKLLTAVALDVAGRIQDNVGFPAELAAFPREGLVANSERFILRNFQGLAFLRNGFQAGYRLDGLEFECFIVESKDEAAAEAAARQYLDHFRAAGSAVEAKADGWEFQDRYMKNVFVGRRGRYLYGVSRIPEGRQDTGRAYLGKLRSGLGGPQGSAATGGER